MTTTPKKIRFWSKGEIEESGLDNLSLLVPFEELNKRNRWTFLTRNVHSPHSKKTYKRSKVNFWKRDEIYDQSLDYLPLIPFEELDRWNTLVYFQHRQYQLMDKEGLDPYFLPKLHSQEGVQKLLEEGVLPVQF